MGRSRLPIVIYFIVGFAVIGLISSLIRNPGSFITSILIAIGVGFVLYLILTSFINRRSQGTNDEMRKYRKAVKQSKLKYSNQQKQSNPSQRTRPSTPIRTKKKRRNVPHLTVIEGKKSNNNKDRASN